MQCAPETLQVRRRLSGSAARGLVRLLEGNRLLFAGAIIAQGIAVASETGGFFLIRGFVDDITAVESGSLPFHLFALGFIGLALLRGVLSFFSGRGGARTAEEVTRQVRNALYDNIQRLSFTYHDKTQTGELIQRSTSDVDAVRQFYGQQVMGVARIVFLFAINFACLMFIEWRLALISIVVIPAIVLISSFFFKKIFAAYEALQEQDGKVSSVLQENLSGVRVVRAFARQRFEERKFEEVNREKLRRGLRLIMTEAMYWPVSHITCTIQLVAGVTVGALMTLGGVISVGTFLAYTGMVNQIIWPMQQLGRLITQISQSFVSYRRVAEILREDQEDTSSGYSVPGVRLSGRLEFLNVGFSYTEEIPVLRNVSFDAEPGMKIALLGATGSGKTTLVNLLPRFYEYTEGRILLDGRPLPEYSKHYLRRNIGIVEQEPFLFSMSIRENITYGRDGEVSEEEVIAAAKAAAIHDSILSFPEGYETLVGERGVTLSGGQKQRIAIARTLVKDPAILILDDSTSAVDAETEEQIRDALENLMRGRTTFIIAHRVQSLMDADLILVFKEGEIIQRGTHRELIAEEGFYRRVFELQTRIEAELEEELEDVSETTV
jgi:ATP-binding cassette subfamily B protein